MKSLSRRAFLQTSSAALAGALAASAPPAALAQEAGERPARAANVSVLLPRERVPLSFIIDDSTCLVNLNKFAIPQFAAAWGPGSAYEKYDWRSWPDEIPDDFVRKFGDWCGEHGVKGKYSIVPFPACVGRVDRELPGWTARELEASLAVVRDRLLANWDIHPEMVTHTRVIDLKTGHPFPERSLKFMENWEWTTGRSADEIADYLRYALQILKNVDLPCEGITTPGGFGNRALPQLSRASLLSLRDVYDVEIPHYFRHAYASGNQSVAPRVEQAARLDGDRPECVVSIVACTGDWTGGWDNTEPEGPDPFIVADGSSGRLVEIIERGEPACLLAHWTGIWHNGAELGFKVFQEVVRRLSARFSHLAWMKLSEIARYWAARELTRIGLENGEVRFSAPFAAPDFTVRVSRPNANPRPWALADTEGNRRELREVTRREDLQSGTWRRDRDGDIIRFDLPRGRSRLVPA